MCVLYYNTAKNQSTFMSLKKQSLLKLISNLPRWVATKTGFVQQATGGRLDLDNELEQVDNQNSGG